MARGVPTRSSILPRVDWVDTCCCHCSPSIRIDIDINMTRTKRASKDVRKSSQGAKRPPASKKSIPVKAKAVVVLKLNPEQQIKRRLGRSVTHRSRVPVVMDGNTSCAIAKMGRRRMAANIISELSPSQHMMIRPSITTITARAIECVIGSLAERAQGWNTMKKGKTMMPPMLHRAFADYCIARGGVWSDVMDEANMIVATINNGELRTHDAKAMEEYAATSDGIHRKAIRALSSAKARATKMKRAAAESAASVA